MAKQMISEIDIKKLVGEVMKEGLTYTAYHTGELKEENEKLKYEKEELKEKYDELEHMYNNMAKHLASSLNADNVAAAEETSADLEKQIKAAKDENDFLKEKVRHMELKLLGHQRLITKLQK